mmetsp:Transcript_78302/g.211862  ORF Transcript_78302/g.211862 Transcript_78302/m.211862 type:complete len:233 (+) Transcript_78302:1529-2227(+)
MLPTCLRAVLPRQTDCIFCALFSRASSGASTTATTGTPSGAEGGPDGTSPSGDAAGPTAASACTIGSPGAFAALEGRDSRPAGPTLEGREGRFFSQRSSVGSLPSSDLLSALATSSWLGRACCSTGPATTFGSLRAWSVARARRRRATRRRASQTRAADWILTICLLRKALCAIRGLCLARVWMPLTRAWIFLAARWRLCGVVWPSTRSQVPLRSQRSTRSRSFPLRGWGPL